MKTKRRSSSIRDPIRWTLERAATEFAINPRTLSGRIKRNFIEAGPDGRWSTQQIMSAVVGDMDGEKLAKLRAERELTEIRLGEARQELVSAETVLQVLTDIATAIRQIVKGSKLSTTEKNQCLKEIRTLKASDFVRRQPAAAREET